MPSRVTGPVGSATKFLDTRSSITHRDSLGETREPMTIVSFLGDASMLMVFSNESVPSGAALFSIGIGSLSSRSGSLVSSALVSFEVVLRTPDNASLMIEEGLKTPELNLKLLSSVGCNLANKVSTVSDSKFDDAPLAMSVISSMVMSS